MQPEIPSYGQRIPEALLSLIDFSEPMDFVFVGLIVMVVGLLVYIKLTNTSFYYLNNNNRAAVWYARRMLKRDRKRRLLGLPLEGKRARVARLFIGG